MKKILIFYGSYGGGHISAAKSIKQEIEENYKDIEVKMVDCIEYINKYINKLTTEAYKELAKKAPLLCKHISKEDSKIYIQVDSDCDGYTSASLLLNYIHAQFPSAINKFIYGFHDGKIHGLKLEIQVI